MTVEQAVAEHLVAANAVTTLVSTRVYLQKLPQLPTLPAVVVQLVAVMDFYHLRGGDQMERSLVQVDAYADEASGGDPYASVAAVADAVHDTLNAQQFAAAGSIDVEITGVFRRTRMPMYEAQELRQMRMLQEYHVWSRRSA